jgi:hypothetical protein
MSPSITNLQKNLLEVLRGDGRRCDWWAAPGAADQSARLYLNIGRRDVKIWLQFKNAMMLEAPELRVRIDECGQHENWYASQREKLMERFADAVLAAVAVAAGQSWPPEEKEEVA